MPKRKRYVLSATEARSPIGERVIMQILAIAVDQDITLDEVRFLARMLDKIPDDVEPLHHLRTQLSSALEDGQLDAGEKIAIRRAMERVLPRNVRLEFADKLSGFSMEYEADDVTPLWKHAAATWRKDPITARQLEYIRVLGGSAHEGMTKGDASIVIDDLLARRLPSRRQIMLLRFLDRMDLATLTKEEVSEAIDEIFEQEEWLARAWDRFKIEHGDHERRINDPTLVPIGEFRRYTPAYVAKSQRTAARVSQSKGCLVVVFTFAAIGVGLLGAARWGLSG